MGDFWRIFDSHMQAEMTPFVTQVAARVLLAALLGGAIGLERELKKRPSGLRTNMLICFGSALFTILSERLAGDFSGDHTRIAAQIIPGIGFIGAGSILHQKGSVSGLTSAATIFVVAAIGMAAGGGLFMPAIFATTIVLAVLLVLGFVEARVGYKPLAMSYSAECASVDLLLKSIHETLEAESIEMHALQLVPFEQHYRAVFTVEATREQHQNLLRAFTAQASISHFASISAVEQE